MSPLVRPQPIGGSRLVVDYLHEDPAALEFFPGPPHRLRVYRNKLEELRSRFGRAARADAASALFPSSDLARDRLTRFVEEGGVFVTTGQQTGFLTGPLYTIYKAISAVVLARHLERELGTLVLPLFWVASEDHDWAEVNHSYLLDPSGRLRRFALVSEDQRPLPMSERALQGDLEELCDDVLQFVATNEHTSTLARAIVDPYRRVGGSVSGAFKEAITALLGRFDMVFADASDPVLKGLSRPVVAASVLDAENHERRLLDRTERLVAAGYNPQVAVLEGGTNVFIIDDRGRERLYRRKTDYVVRDRKGSFTADELLSAIDSNPTRFSPNVLLRPVVESAVFPSIAYVGGPGEIAYFAQAGALFDALGMIPPVVVPRFSGVVVEPATERSLTKLDLTQADLLASREELAERLARRDVPSEAVSSLEAIRRELVAGFDRLTDQVEGIDPTLVGSLGAIRNRALYDSRRAERKIIRALKRGDSQSISQLDRVLNTLRPQGAAQDRVLNVLPFIAKYGEHFLTQIEVAIETHWRMPASE